MLTWLSQNVGTILVCAVIIAVFALLIRSLIRDRKKGKSSCCGGCAGCANACHCHPATATEPSADTAEEAPPAHSTEAEV